ncbi:RHS repeat-associated core domain-containing protein [Blastopirellula marina]|uniref:RHS repeat-associated core domain-containing protein n=1 Tax=Blastopirellula marina TaxID=124 RepID=UPI003965888D
MGDAQERFAYQPYGESLELDLDFTAYYGSDLAWSVRLTGRKVDLDTGLQINRNRYLHLQLGCWTTRDPIGYIDGLNIYSYCNSNPPTILDPTGLIW